MANKRKLNYLLGFGERLTTPIPKPGGGGDKKHPYNFSEAQRRLSPQVERTVEIIEMLPRAACPNDQAVATITLHPTYLAKTYYPEELFNAIGVRPVGSRQKEIEPTNWATEKHPLTATTAEFFIAGSRTRFRELAESIGNWTESTRGAEELKKFESFQFPEGLIKPMRSDSLTPLLEVVLHASGEAQSYYILDGFKSYLNSLDIDVDLDQRLHSGGLCFLPVKVPRETIDKVAKFSFLRVLREMPTLRQFRPIIKSVGASLALTHELPEGEPIDPSIRVAVFDGGLPESPNLNTWVRYKEQEPLEEAVPDFENHGLAVTSALLFGTLEHGKPLDRPFSYVDHYRVLDIETGKDSQGELLDVLRRIRNILQNQKYHFVNLSIGPDLPIEDDEVSAWTAVLDPLFSDGQTLPTIAVGNSGDLDWESGNARIQTPSDCVNGFSIGSCDQQEISWKRASYSSIGPGRSPGYVKPDALSFGGSKTNPFYVLDRGVPINSIPTTGTSFAAPNALRTAIGIRALLGNSISPLAIKALMLNRCENNGYGPQETGRGRIINSLEKLITCEDSTAHIVYQGQLSPAQWIRAKIPLPFGELKGFVEISATICFATEIDTQDTVNYTRSGLEIYFRPHSKKFGRNTSNPQAQPFFQSFGDGSEISGRKDAHKWETTLNASKKMRAVNLDDPVLDIHYNARTSGGPANNPQNISYALVITVRAPQNPDLYDRIVQRYRTSLEVLRPAIEIPIRS